MFNGLDELEEFADRLAPLTPEESADWNQRKAAARVGQPVAASPAAMAPLPEIAPELGTAPQAVSEMASEPEPLQARSPSPEPTLEPEPAPEVISKAEPTQPATPPAPLSARTSEEESGPESNAEAVQQAIAEIEAAPEVEVSDSQPVLAVQPDAVPESEPAPATRTRLYTGYIVGGGLVLLGLVLLLL